MTQEEKLEEAKRLYKTANADQKYVLESLFPELKESEDERIRKEIRDFICWATSRGGCITKEQMEKSNLWLAWLEKQGEQKPAENKGMNLVEEEMTPFQKKVFCIIDTTIEEEQGLKQVCDELLTLASNEIKQKPITEMKSVEESLGIDSETYNKIVDECIYGEQKHAEWSDEDEVKINRIVACLENLNVADNDILLKDVDWLKSLKPQKQWKPSDEQMDALDDFIYAKYPNTEKYGVAVKSLYQDLKKLKEE